MTNKCEFCDRDIENVDDIGFNYYDDNGIEHCVCRCCWSSVITHDNIKEKEKENVKEIING